MGFRFRKSFKLMPGVRVNMSKSGFSTTIGGRGASVNISKRGTYVNAGIPGTGISSRSRVGGSRSSASANHSYVPAQPKVPQPASTRVFSFGVAIAVVGVFACFTLLVDPDKTSSTSNPWGGIAFWTAFGVIWWYVRKWRRASQQRTYEVYVKQQADEAIALQTLIQEQAQQRQLAFDRAAWERQAALDREALEREQAFEQKVQQRRASFEPHFERARGLVREGIMTEADMLDLEKSIEKSWMTPSAVGLGIDMTERRVRTELHRKDMILSKYDEATAHKLLLCQIEPGMSRQHVIDSMGDTSKTERTLIKGGERETLIYGSKTSGSYFHIVGGIVVKAVVR